MRWLAFFFGVTLSAAQQPSAILISIDTLRADALGCYGGKKVRTPHMDELARGGTLFTQISSPVPLTLPAHMSMLSSTYPFTHGVEENGERIGAGAVTLATVLKARGYRTAAFIGGYVLDARFGLNQGFDVYDSPFHLSPQPGEDPPEVKRPAETVLRGAAEWMAKQSGHPVFVFTHLYDVHQPYSHGSYFGEVAYVDEAIGKFRRELDARGRLQDTLIALTSDHGESLGEHGEDTHGYFIYQSTLRVPVILHWPASGNRPARVDRPASLIGLAPTVLEFLGVPAPPQFHGRSLMRPDEEPVYSESMYARDHLGCAALRSVRTGRYKYIDAPKPELYDLQADPAESHNRYSQEPALSAKLKARLEALSPATRRPPPNPASAEVLARLRSLGYLGGGGSRAASAVDPKDRLALYRRYGRAIHMANTGQLSEAIAEFRRVLREDPQNLLAHFYIGVCYYRMHRLDDAAAALKDIPAYPPAEELLGTIWLLKKDYVRAREQFEHLAVTTPGSYGAHYNLGILAMREGRIDEAVRELQAAAKADPGAAAPHSALSDLYRRRGDLARAAEESRKVNAIEAGAR